MRHIYFPEFGLYSSIYMVFIKAFFEKKRFLFILVTEHLVFKLGLYTGLEMTKFSIEQSIKLIKYRTV